MPMSARVTRSPVRTIALAYQRADPRCVSVLRRLVCTVRGHAWGPVEGDANGAALRTCARCGRSQPVDLQPKPYKGVVPDGGTGGGAGT